MTHVLFIYLLLDNTSTWAGDVVVLWKISVLTSQVFSPTIVFCQNKYITVKWGEIISFFSYAWTSFKANHSALFCLVPKYSFWHKKALHCVKRGEVIWFDYLVVVLAFTEEKKNVAYMLRQMFSALFHTQNTKQTSRETCSLTCACPSTHAYTCMLLIFVRTRTITHTNLHTYRPNVHTDTQVHAICTRKHACEIHKCTQKASFFLTELLAVTCVSTQSQMWTQKSSWWLSRLSRPPRAHGAVGSNLIYSWIAVLFRVRKKPGNAIFQFTHCGLDKVAWERRYFKKNWQFFHWDINSNPFYTWQDKNTNCWAVVDLFTLSVWTRNS